jgi:hypothetical protein
MMVRVWHDGKSFFHNYFSSLNWWPHTPQKLPCHVHTFVRPLDHVPPNCEVWAKQNGKGVISPILSK